VVGYDAGQQQYHVNWKTEECVWGSCTLDPARIYRLTVSVGSRALGHVDLQVFSNASQAKNVNTNEYIGLVEGRTLPIRFRVETGIVAGISISPNPATIPVGETRQLTATLTDLHGGQITGGSVTWTTADATKATVSANGVVSGIAGGCTTVSAASRGVQATAAITVTPTSPDIAYVGSDLKLWVTDAASCNARRLNDIRVYPTQPVWSRDGTKLAVLTYSEVDGGTVGISTVNADGSGLRALPITIPVGAYRPSWSPDGTRLVFVGQVQGGGGRANPTELFVINADGSGQQKITAGTTVPLDGPDDAWNWTASPRWSPSGDQITFYSYMLRGGSTWYDVFVVNADGTGQRRLTAGCAQCNTQGMNPDWTPDGANVLYYSDYGQQLSSVRPDATSRRVVASPGGPSFESSPSGTRIAFVRQNPGTSGSLLEVINGDGTGRTTVVTGELGNPTWSSNGSSLFYDVIDRVAGVKLVIHRVSPDGTGDQSVTLGRYPSARP
jgi:Tol biopolymer transport system component